MVPSQVGLCCFSQDYSFMKHKPEQTSQGKHAQQYKAFSQSVIPPLQPFNQNIPRIVVDTVPDETAPSSAPVRTIADFNALQVPLNDIRNQVVDDIKQEEDQAVAEAKAAADDVKRAVIKIAKKTFFLKLVKSVISISALAVAIGLAVPTGGLSIIAAGVFGIASIFSVADTITAAVDWGLKSHGKAGLPMASDATSNLAYLLFRGLSFSDERAKKCAGWTAMVSKAVLTIGLLWADSVTPQTTIKPATIDKGGSTVLEMAGAKLAKYADSINMTKAKLEALEQQSALQDKYALIMKNDATDIELIDDWLDKSEDEIEAFLKQSRQDFLSKKKELLTQLQTSRKQLDHLREAIKSVTEQNKESAFKELSRLIDEKKSADLLLMPDEERHNTRHSVNVFCAAQVPLPSEFDYSQEAEAELHAASLALASAQSALSKAQRNFKAHNVAAKVIRCVFSILGIAGSCVATIYTGPIAAPLIVFSVGSAVSALFDAGGAISEYQRQVKGKPPLPIKDDGMANTLNSVFTGCCNVSKERSINISRKVAGAIQVVFTLGGKWPEKDPDFTNQLDQNTKYLTGVYGVIEDELLDDDAVKATTMDRDIQNLKKKLAEEQIYRLQVAYAYHTEHIAKIRYAHKLQCEAMQLEKKGLQMSLVEVDDVIEKMERLIAQLPEALKKQIDDHLGHIQSAFEPSPSDKLTTSAILA